MATRVHTNIHIYIYIAVVPAWRHPGAGTVAPALGLEAGLRG